LNFVKRGRGFKSHHRLSSKSYAERSLPETVAAYIRAINDHDAAAFIALFADGVTINDMGREFRGCATGWCKTGCGAR
jgi:hypothetical protein